MIYEGACHCGAARAALRTELSPPPVRACQCGFCRRHGAATTSDPAGKLTLSFASTPRVYRFASRASEVLICPGCGVYVASCIDTREGKRATLNIVGMAVAELITLAPSPVSYEAEGAEAKRARRLANWTPTEIAGNAR
ncbi:MAG: hypothetical protein JNJ73_11995 [Hyphomonadaceae bacterium]|nr:hypothetical protein [Hyphomonadaceae bacterium]